MADKQASCTVPSLSARSITHTLDANYQATIAPKCIPDCPLKGQTLNMWSSLQTFNKRAKYPLKRTSGEGSGLQGLHVQVAQIALRDGGWQAFDDEA
ncbi:hypothetical protein RvY_18301 [Ramazzottius varieornatus]|uniref:Uncharacterized protein n=1 Tax=Ramazzottius varieornatus TaxID=947166 RepID=A0A1D1W8L1_RAMVA|nr:hypothetical protein RvY_18301 [Ramazzottius varieornatus]